MRAALGVDLGATWLRACLAAGGRAKWTARAPAVDSVRLAAVLSRILRKRGVRRVGTLTVGGTGLGGAGKRAECKRALAPLAARVRILPDFEIAHMAAFGGGAGVVLVASTGSVAFARGLDGRARRAGGLGPLFGDEGSGFWLGRAGARDPRLRSALRLPRPLDLAHAAEPVRATAALAPRVLRSSRRLRERAAVHLARIAREAARGLRLPRPIPIALHGGLWRDAPLKTSVLRRLGRGWRPVEPRLDAARAAAGL